MTQDKFEEFVRSALDEVPPVPRDEMWARIEEARRFRRPRDHGRRTQWIIMATALAAMLVLGIALGRVSMVRQLTPQSEQVAQTEQPNSPVAQQPSSPAAQITPTQGGGLAAPRTNAPANGAYTVAAIEHLGRAEILLSAVSSGSVDQQLVGWAKDMLTSTQLLLDSPAANDTRMATLLQDLELILTQIASSRSEELDLIQHGIKETDVLPRLRATALAGYRARPVGT